MEDLLKNVWKNMLKQNKSSNAQSWELEVTCKNKQFLHSIVDAILKRGHIEFEVTIVESWTNQDNSTDGRYVVFMWSSWFNNLAKISKDLKKIEKLLDPLFSGN